VEAASSEEVVKTPEPPSLPKPPTHPESASTDFAKLLYQAQLDAAIARYQAELDEFKARQRDIAANDLEEQKLEAAQSTNSFAAEDALRLAIQAAYLDVAKGSLERSLKRANFVTAAAGTIGTSYAGLLGLVYTLSGSTPRPLPLYGIAPTIFLGISFLLSAYYVAYIRTSEVQGDFLPAGIGSSGLQQRRMLFFLKWASKGVLQRAAYLRWAVICLGVGIALLPLPFLARSPEAAAGSQNKSEVTKEDLAKEHFAKKMECNKLQDNIQRELKSNYPNSGVTQFQIFYSPKRNSCVHAYQATVPVDKGGYVDYTIMDSLSGEQLFSQTAPAGNGTETATAATKFNSEISILKTP